MVGPQAGSTPLNSLPSDEPTNIDSSVPGAVTLKYADALVGLKLTVIICPAFARPAVRALQRQPPGYGVAAPAPRDGALRTGPAACYPRSRPLSEPRTVDFLKIIRSLEELLYEVMTWLVFYPRTMWRIVVHPLATTVYSEHEQTDTATEQYTDTLSPPLLLMLTLLISHGLALGLGAKTLETDSAIGKTLFGSAQNLLMLRALAFSIFPLTAATTLLRRRRLAIDRTTLRGPFFSQCYLTAPFALAVSSGMVLMRSQAGAAKPAGAAVALLGLAWYLAVETRWFQRQLELPAGRALLVGLWAFARAAFYWFVLGAALVAVMG